MATKDQYEFFRKLYEEENDRNKDLTKKSEIYLSIISLFFTAVLFKLKDLYDLIKDNPNEKVLIYIFVMSLSILTIGLLLVILSLKIRNFEGVMDGENYIENLEELPPSDSDFFDERITDYIVAEERNDEVNNKKADLLVWAGYLILFGLFSIAIFCITLIVSL